MRRLAAAMALSLAAFSIPAQASDDLYAGLAPLDDALLALATGGVAPRLDASSVDLSAASSLQASVMHVSTRIAGVLKTGDVDLGAVSGVRGGVTSVQIATGFGNIQQSSVALAFAF